MVEELIFHMGDCKTGSTALQSVLASGTYTLSQGTIFYPAGLNHNGLAQTIAPDLHKMDAEQRAKRFAAMARMMRNSDARWGIISAEFFEFVPASGLKAALDEFFGDFKGRIRLMSYVRPHVDRIVSTHAEAIKLGSQQLSQDDFLQSRLRSGRFHYTQRYAALRSTFGDAFTLRLFQRDALVNGDVVADFFEWLTGGNDTKIGEVPSDNRSLSVEELSMIAELHRAVMAKAGDIKSVRTRMGRQFATFQKPHPDRPATRYRLQSAIFDKAQAAYAADAEAMDAAFFTGSPMTRALSDAAANVVPTSQSLLLDDNFSPSEACLIRSWAQFTARVVAADPDHFAWACAAPDERAATYLAKAPVRPRRPWGKQLFNRIRRHLFGGWR